MLRRFVLAMLIGMITEAVVTGVLQHPSILIGIVVGLTAVAAVFAATRSRENRPHAKAAAPLDAEDTGAREISDAHKT
jgi:xanthine/uracil permease